MKNTVLCICGLIMSVVLMAEERPKTDWGYIKASLESNDAFYVKDAANGFDPADYPYLDGDRYASNNYLKVDYYKGRLSAGMQVEGYFPTLIGYPISKSMLSLSNLYVSWKDKSYSVTAGSFYDQFGSGLLFRSWEDRMLGLNHALLGVRATYNWEDKIAAKVFYGMPRLDKFGDNAQLGYKADIFGLGLADVHVAGADVSVSLSSLLNLDGINLSVEGSVLDKYEMLSELDKLSYNSNTIGWSGRANFEYDGFFVKGEYVDAGKIYSFADAGNAQLLEFGYNGKGLGLSFTGRRLEKMTQRIYNGTSDFNVWSSPVNMLSYIPAMTTQYTYMLMTLNPYSPKQDGEIGGQVDAYYNFRRGTKIGGKRGMRVHANFSTYYTLDQNGKASGGHFVYRDFSLDVEKQWTKKFKTTLMYMTQKYDYSSSEFSKPIHVVVADMLYKWSSKLSTRMELQYLATEDVQGDWLAGLLEVNFAPHWSVFASDMWNHGSTKTHYYNAGLSYTIENLRVAAGYGRYKKGYICSGGVCRTIPAYTGANLALTLSF